MKSFYNEKKTIYRSIIEKQLMRNWKPDAHLYGIYVSVTHEYTRTCIYIYIYKSSRSIFHQPCTERGWVCWKEGNVKWTRVGSHPRTILWFAAAIITECVLSDSRPRVRLLHVSDSRVRVISFGIYARHASPSARFTKNAKRISHDVLQRSQCRIDHGSF